MAEQEKLTTITLPCAKGIETSTQLEALDAQIGFVAAENVRQYKRGALSKRHGFDALPGDPTVTGHHVFDWRGSPAVVYRDTNAFRVRHYSASGWANSADGSYLSEVIATRYAIASVRDLGSPTTGTESASVDSCAFGDLQITSVIPVGTTDCDLIWADGESALWRTSVGNCVRARLIQFADSVGGSRQAMLVYSRPDTAVCWRILTLGGTGPIVGAESVIAPAAVTNDGPVQWWDACPCNGGVFIAWLTATGVSGVELDASFTLIDSFSDPGFANSTSVAVGAFAQGAVRTRFVFVSNNSLGNQEWLVRRDAANVMSAISLASGVPSSALRAGVLGTGTDSAIVVNNRVNQTVLYRVRGMVVDGAREFSNARVMSMPFSRTGVQYALMRDSGGERIAVVCELFRDSATGPVAFAPIVRPVASIAPRLVPDMGGALTSVVEVSGSESRISIPVGVSSLSLSVQVAKLSFTRQLVGRWSSVSLCGCQYFGGGVVEKFDGLSLHEAAFLHRPSVKSVNTLGAAGNVNTANGPVSWLVIYEHVDNQGNLEQSAPSAPRLVNTIADSKQITLTVSPLHLTQRYSSGTPPKVVLYRTISGGKNYYRVESKIAISATDISFVDNVSDASLQSRPLLYKTPGQPNDFVDHSAPSALFPLSLHQGRIVGVSDDGVALWPSNAAVSGEGVYWSEAFNLPVPEGGRCTALASLDSSLAVFKRSSVYVVSGDGPAENGAPGYTMQRVPSSSGCVEHTSVVSTVDGVWFRGDYGLQLLARGGAVVAAGEPVVAELGPGVLVTSAVLDDRNQCVLWTLTGGRTLVFDQVSRAWYTDRVAFLDSSSATAEHAAMVGRYTRLQRQEASVLVESDGHADPSGINNGWIPCSLETGWVRLAGLVGEQRVTSIYLLSHHDGAHGIEATVGYNYRPLSSTPARTYTSGQIAELASGYEAYRCDIETGNDNRGAAIRIRIADKPPSPVVAGPGGAWVGLVFEGTSRATHERKSVKGR